MGKFAFLSLINRCIFSFYNSFFCLYFFGFLGYVFFCVIVKGLLCWFSPLCFHDLWVCHLFIFFHVLSTSSMTPNRILKFIITEPVIHFQLTSPPSSSSFTTKAKRKFTILCFLQFYVLEYISTCRLDTIYLFSKQNFIVPAKVDFIYY